MLFRSIDPQSEMDMDPAEAKVVPAAGYTFDQPFMPTAPHVAPVAPVAEATEDVMPATTNRATATENAFMPVRAPTEQNLSVLNSITTGAQKRKNEEEAESSVSKRVEVDPQEESMVADPGFASVGELVEYGLGGQTAKSAGSVPGQNDDDDDDDDDESVHLNMELDTDEDGDEDDEE